MIKKCVWSVAILSGTSTKYSAFRKWKTNSNTNSQQPFQNYEIWLFPGYEKKRITYNAQEKIPRNMA